MLVGAVGDIRAAEWAAKQLAKQPAGAEDNTAAGQELAAVCIGWQEAKPECATLIYSATKLFFLFMIHHSAIQFFI